MSWQAARGLYRRNHQAYGPGPCPLCGQATTEPGTSWAERGNEAEGSAITDGPISLDEFLEILQVDTDTWEVADWGAKRWQVGAKIKHGDLEWTEGRITGDLHYRGLGKENLWSTWAKFRRRCPIPFEPIVRPVVCEPSPRLPPEAPVGTPILRALLGADLHLGYTRNVQTGKLEPYHDRAAIDLFLRVAEHLQPDHIELLGDFLDLPMWTDKFARSPEFYWTTQPAILEGHWILRQLRRACPRSTIDLFMGNHEERISKTLVRHLIEACHLKPADEMDLPPAMSPQRLLGLHLLDVNWIESEVWLGQLCLDHGEIARQPPGATARAQAEEGKASRAYGHVHRIESVSTRVKVRDDPLCYPYWRTVRAFSVPCLCRIDGTVPGNKESQNWQQGFGVVDYTFDEFTEQLIEITGMGIGTSRALFDRRIWRGEDYTDHLREDLPDWNW